MASTTSPSMSKTCTGHVTSTSTLSTPQWLEKNEEMCFLDVGSDNFLALFRRDPSHINHFCFTVDGYEPDEAAAELEGTGHELIRREDRVFVRDPDGHLVQVSAAATAEHFTG